MRGDRTAREDPVNPDEPLVVALDMGYGHLRAAAAVAEAAGTRVHEADRAPLADDEERASWRRARSFYETLSRGTEWPVVGPAFRRALDLVTDIPKMRGGADLRAPNAAAKMLRRMAAQGLGRGLVETLRRTGRPLVSTFYAPAIVAADAGIPRVTLVVTDVDVNRVWVPVDPAETAMTWCVPGERTAERLRRYGVPEARIRVTGFPLAPSLVGGEDSAVLRAHLARRIARLDPSGSFRAAAGPEMERLGVDAAVRDDAIPRITLAVGGAGAQVESAIEVLAALGGGVVAGRWELALVAGTRASVASEFRAELARLGLAARIGRGIEILEAPDFASYLARFEELLSRTDALWTKPSELTFHAALGVPLLLARPLGVHEKANRRWALERGVATDARSGDAARLAVERGLADGALAAAAWNGFVRLPRHGAWRVLETVR